MMAVVLITTLLPPASTRSVSCRASTLSSAAMRVPMSARVRPRPCAAVIAADDVSASVSATRLFPGAAVTAASSVVLLAVLRLWAATGAVVLTTARAASATMEKYFDTQDSLFRPTRHRRW
jgi:hypothetical protein